VGGKGGAKKRVAWSAEGDERGAAAISGSGRRFARRRLWGTWVWESLFGGEGVGGEDAKTTVCGRWYFLPNRPGSFCRTLLDVGAGMVVVRGPCLFSREATIASCREG